MINKLIEATSARPENPSCELHENALVIINSADSSALSAAAAEDPVSPAELV